MDKDKAFMIKGNEVGFYDNVTEKPLEVKKFSSTADAYKAFVIGDYIIQMFCRNCNIKFVIEGDEVNG